MIPPRPPAMPEPFRPYPQEGLRAMSDEDWAAIEPQWVSIAELTPTQTDLSFDRLSALLSGDPPEGGDLYGHTVEYRGRLYDHDGHHRNAISWLSGAEKVLVRVKVVSDKGG